LNFLGAVGGAYQEHYRLGFYVV